MRILGWLQSGQGRAITYYRGSWRSDERYGLVPDRPIRSLLLTSTQVPVNLKDRDAFHVTIEEYLLALVSLIEELVRPYRVD